MSYFDQSTGENSTGQALAPVEKPNTASPQTTATIPDSNQVRLIGTMEVAQMLGCSDRTVRRLIQNGRTPTPMRHGSAFRWDCDVIQQWLASGSAPMEQPGGTAEGRPAETSVSASTEG